MGKDATVIGVSNHVGRPMALELLLAGCSVSATHKFTSNVREYVEYADIVISAVGIPGLIKGAWIKPGATVIDVGITRDDQGRLHGDVEFDEVFTRVRFRPLKHGDPRGDAHLATQELDRALPETRSRPERFAVLDSDQGEPTAQSLTTAQPKDSDGRGA